MVSMTTGEVNNSLFKTGSLRISSILAYLELSSVMDRDEVAFDPQDDNGNVVAARPPTTAVEINLRRSVLITYSFSFVFLDDPIMLVNCFGKLSCQKLVYVY